MLGRADLLTMNIRVASEGRFDIRAIMIKGQALASVWGGIRIIRDYKGRRLASGLSA